MGETFKVGALAVERGKTGCARLACSELAEGTPITIPVMVVNGEKPGPVLFILGGCHGDEVIGTVMAQEITNSVDPKNLNGTLITVPIANVLSYLTRSRGFLHEERGPVNMGSSFPGNEKGPLTERLAYTIFNELVIRSTHMIDLHAGLTGACCYPFTYLFPPDDTHGTLKVREEMAKVCGLPLVFRLTRDRSASFGSMAAGYNKNLAGQCEERGIPRIILEMGEADRVTKEFLPMGLRAIYNIMKYLRMIPGKPELPKTKQLSFPDFWNVRANRGGVLSIEATLGSPINQGDLIGRVYGPFDIAEEITAPGKGVLLRVMTNAIIYPGAEVAWVAQTEG